MIKVGSLVRCIPTEWNLLEAVWVLEDVLQLHVGDLLVVISINQQSGYMDETMTLHNLTTNHKITIMLEAANNIFELVEEEYE